MASGFIRFIDISSRGEVNFLTKSKRSEVSFALKDFIGAEIICFTGQLLKGLKVSADLQQISEQ